MVRDKRGSFDDLINANRVRATNYENSEQEKKAALRNVCGARSVKDAADARYLLEVAGLIDEFGVLT